MQISPDLIIAPHILVVDDDDRLRSLIRRYLIENGCVVASASNAKDRLNGFGHHDAR